MVEAEGEGEVKDMDHNYNTVRQIQTTPMNPMKEVLSAQVKLGNEGAFSDALLKS